VELKVGLAEVPDALVGLVLDTALGVRLAVVAVEELPVG
jgi:hypothetical protein